MSKEEKTIYIIWKWLFSPKQNSQSVRPLDNLLGSMIFWNIYVSSTIYSYLVSSCFCGDGKHFISVNLATHSTEKILTCWSAGIRFYSLSECKRESMWLKCFISYCYGYVICIFMLLQTTWFAFMIIRSVTGKYIV